MTRSFDIAVIGAGTVGCAVARDLARYDCETVLLEANADLGDESSKGNSAILCSGYDTPSGTLERRLVMRGCERYHAEAGRLGLPIERIGALTVAYAEDEVDGLKRRVQAAREEGFASVAYLDAPATYAKAPHLGKGALGALWCPDESIVDPFSTPYAYALEAVDNGVTFLRSTPVTAARSDGHAWRLETPAGVIRCQLVINCGGLRADQVETLAGHDGFSAKPVRGQYIVFDKLARPLLDAIVCPAPTPSSRGILITPTIFGNILVGPTAEPVADRDDRRVTNEGLNLLLRSAYRMLPGLSGHMVTTTFAGMRPGTDPPGYHIVPRLDERWVTVAGIRSTGLSAALGIAEYVCDQVIPGVIDAPRRSDYIQCSVPDLSYRRRQPWERSNADPAADEIVCHCERIALSEIRDCLSGPLAPRSLKSLKRRTRVMFGRCQGFYCGARVEALFQAAQSEQP